MPDMADPALALKIFQDALLAGPVELELGRLDSEIFMHGHRGHVKPQFTYVRLEGQTVTAFATFVLNGTYKGHPNLAVGYAVPEAFRNQGRAKDILRTGIAELRNGFKGFPPFFVEAVVSVDNFASLRVAADVLGGEPESLMDAHSGQPALRYARKFETSV